MVNIRSRPVAYIIRGSVLYVDYMLLAVAGRMHQFTNSLPIFDLPVSRTNLTQLVYMLRFSSLNEIITDISV